MIAASCRSGSPLTSGTRCSTIASGGLCSRGPTAAVTVRTPVIAMAPTSPRAPALTTVPVLRSGIRDPMATSLRVTSLPSDPVNMRRAGGGGI
ncbi:hypothetical protein GCM10009546_28350 [Actinomadura livida]|uniref:Uncharacterized protein n=1 Tax=Actinomadura livida TaxID=79909 RepID=A0ABN1EDI1_9ACTN|nr:hypothetical protein GCM10010208_35510 [Actinomadura livida]